MRVILALVFLVIYALASASAFPRVWQPIPEVDTNSKEQKCGYESCPKPKPGMINVHIVPHTHDDVGWLKTVDQYYYGSKNTIQKAGVQYIIDSVVQELLKDPAKKFIYVESAFFFKWWHEQTEELQEKVKMLVNEGRLEFIGGAWSMNDEATAHYQSIVDQFAWGLKRLDDTFGSCGRPRIAWQIDPFGHSREQASLFAQMGYDGLFFGRLDEADKLNRLTNKTMEMIWKANHDLGESSDLFTGALYNQYQPPPGFCFDILCADEPIVDGKHSKENNVDKRLKEFNQFIEVMADSYKTNNVLITMGEDFHYQDANMWYKNLDKLIKYGNQKQETEDSKINLFYSTPSCYLKALHDAKTTWPTKTDDFFPYGSGNHSYWTGYFTSRTTLKRYERIGNHFLQICKQLAVINPRKPKNAKENQMHLDFLRETMGIMQHHDAVTGTEKQKVADDYARRIDIGLRACTQVTREALQNMVNPPDENYEDINVNNVKRDNDVDETGQNMPNLKKEIEEFKFENCLLLNISQCEVSENSENIIVTVYNPLSYANDEYLRLPVPSTYYKVQDYRDIIIPSQIVEIPQSVRALNFRKSAAKYELVFAAQQVPPLGYKSYYISRVAQAPTPPPQPLKPMSGKFEISNKYLTLHFGDTGHLEWVVGNDVNVTLRQDFFYYKGFMGDNREERNRSSGAYIFRPNGTEAYPLTNEVKVKVLGHSQSLVQEVHQKFNDYVSQIIRLYAEENHIEFEWMVGPIPIDDGVGKEIISRYSSDIKSDGIFYTDSSGRQMISRKRDYRETWNYTVTEPISGNYYPILTNIALEDSNNRMAIMVDRAQGGGSIYDGSLEIMVHRRLLKDDAFGVGEPLNETAYGQGLISRGKHYLMVGKSNDNLSPSLKARERFLQIRKHLPLWTFIDDAKNLTYDVFKNQYNLLYSGISVSLPKNIHLLTFEPWHENEILVRFEHIMESGEDSVYSAPVNFHLKDVFRYYKMESIQEMTLDGNMLLSNKNRLKFDEDPVDILNKNKDDKIRVILKMKRDIQSNHYHNQFDIEELPDDEVVLPKETPDPFEITMKPQEIRTFIIKLEPTV